MHDLTTLKVIKTSYWDAVKKIVELAERGYVLASPLPPATNKDSSVLVWMAKPLPAPNDQYRGSDEFHQRLNKGSCLGTP